MVSVAIAISMHVEKTTPESVLKKQIDEVASLNDFMQTEETQIRDVFDFQNIAFNNAIIVKWHFYPDTVPYDEAVRAQKLLGNGNRLVSTDYGFLLRSNTGGFIVREKLGKITNIQLSEKFTTNLDRLKRFESSPFVPKKIKDKIIDLQKAVEKDAFNLIDIINEQNAKNPSLLMIGGAARTQYYETIYNAYWDKFAALNPKSQAISLECSKLLDIQ